MPKAFTLALILAAGAASMAVSATAANEATEQPAAKKAKPKKICKASDKITGSQNAPAKPKKNGQMLPAIRKCKQSHKIIERIMRLARAQNGQPRVLSQRSSS